VFFVSYFPICSLSDHQIFSAAFLPKRSPACCTPDFIAFFANGSATFWNTDDAILLIGFCIGDCTQICPV